MIKALVLSSFKAMYIRCCYATFRGNYVYSVGHMGPCPLPYKEVIETLVP